MSSNLTPLRVAELLLGDKERLAKIIGLSAKAAYRYAHPSTYHAAGEFRSTRHMRKLLEHSNAHDLGLTAEHLIFGADQGEVEAILGNRSAKVAAE